MFKPWSKNERNILKKIYRRTCQKVIRSKLSNRTWSSITSQAFLMGLKRFGQLEFGPEGFLPLASADEAWALGLFVGDGCIVDSGRLHFGSNDRCLVEKVRHILKLGDRRFVKYIKHKRHFFIQRFSRVAAKRFAELGVKPRKSLTIRWEEVVRHVPQVLMSHFVRGLIDSNGSLCFCWDNHKLKNIFHISLSSGSEDFIKGFAAFVRPILGSRAQPIKHPHSKTWALAFGQYKAMKLCSFIYSDSKGIRLERKYKVYLKALCS